jgi:drug/metabolite transporter (DMT)-like permease
MTSPTDDLSRSPGVEANSRWVSYALLGGTVAVLGFNWPLLAIGLDAVSPLWFTSLRLCGAAIVVFAVAWVTGRLGVPDRGDAPVVWSIAIGRMIIVMLLVFTALRLVPPGRSSVLVWTASLWTVPMAVRFLGERMSRRRWIGLSVGIFGILVLVEPWRAELDLEIAGGYGLLLLAAVFHAATAVHVRAHRWIASPLSLLPWQLVVAAIPVTVAAVLVEGAPRVQWTAQLVAIVVYQGVLATGFAMWAQLTVLRRLPAVPTNLTLMLVPVVGLLSSAVIVDEPLTWGAMLGAALVGVGVLSGIDLGRKPPISSPLD